MPTNRRAPRAQAEPIRPPAKPLTAFARFYVPGPVDLVLHSATHVLHDGEWAHGLRDLVDLVDPVDLDALLRAQLAEPVGSRFFPRLLDRAAKRHLGRPLFYGLRYCQQLLGAAAARARGTLFLPALSSAPPPAAPRKAAARRPRRWRFMCAAKAWRRRQSTTTAETAGRLL